MRKITDEEIAKTYERKGCNVTATCLALGITRTTFYNRKKKSRKLESRLQECEESIIDYAESKLMEHIQNGDITSLLFFLKTKGKKRGYVEKTESDVSFNGFEELMRCLPQ